MTQSVGYFWISRVISQLRRKDDYEWETNAKKDIILQKQVLFTANERMKTEYCNLQTDSKNAAFICNKIMSGIVDQEIFWNQLQNICKTLFTLIPPYNLIVFFPTCYKVRLIYYKNQNMQRDKVMDEILIGLWVFINWNWIIFKLII